MEHTRDLGAWQPKKAELARRVEQSYSPGFLWGKNSVTGEPFTPEDRVEYARRRLFLEKTKYSDADINWLMTIAEAWGLDPTKREIYLVTHGHRPTLVVGYQVYLQRTAGRCAGWTVEAFHLKAASEGKEAEKEMIDGTQLKNIEYLNGCVASVSIVRRREDPAFKWEALFAECAPTTWTAEGRGLWNQRPIFMLKKNALSQAFRMCFADIIGGLPYAAEELGESTEPPISTADINWKDIKL